ncbi:nephrocystin-3 [Aspergillus awamori]|uniref:Nephrocystin-3 n=1 Tax=Aspergillus awamori TaxID=105351 RepID=A0A401L244_ASPAW|nr:nephrocystin-3 [Aspergillus awamori]
MSTHETHAIFSYSHNTGQQIGSNTGTIQNQYYYSPERPETPPNPSLFIPFPQDRDFVDRETILQQLDCRCAVPGSRTALVGLSGVGKSQLAIEYAYRIHRRSPETWVFWIYAGNADRFEQSYRDVADIVKLPGRRDPKANIFKLVHDWLRDSRNGNWMVILDNVDDAEFLVNRPRKTQGQVAHDNRRADRPLEQYLPRSPNGSLLITSQSKEAALKIVDQRNIITVDRMNQEHAQALLDRKLGGQSNSQESLKLATMLDCMPLAIIQAAAYISDPDRNCSAQQYINEFQESDHLKIRLLEEDEGQFRRDWEAKNSVLKTWVISFNRIRQNRQSAADLLSLMSFFDCQGIPKTLLQHQHIHNSNTTQSPTNMTDELNKDILKLQRYSLISANIEESFNMHSLVQLVTRRWLEQSGELEKWKQQYIRNLNAAFPTVSYESWAQCQQLFPHARSAADQQPQDRDSLVEWAAVMYKAALFDWQKGNGADGEKLATRAMEIYKEHLGPEHKETLRGIAMLGAIYSLRGRWKEAEKLKVQVLELRKRVLGPEHPDTLTSMSNLGSIYRNQGRWKEAEELEVQVLELRKRVLGPEHPDTLTSIANLASTYWNQGRWKEAEKLKIQVLELRKRVLGPEYPETLTSMANLASTYWNQGRLKEAEELEVQVLELCKRVLGPEHPNTLTSMANLASTYRNQGRWKEGEELEVQVLELRKRVLGPEHPDTLASMANLGSTYRNQGRWKEAEELQVQELELCKQVLGPEHPDTLASMANLGSTYRNQGRWKEAEELQVQELELCKQVLGPEHPDTLASIANLASTYRNQGRWKEGEELEVQVLELRKRVLGPKHPDTLASMANLAFAWKRQGTIKSALALMKQCAELRRNLLGPNHPDTISSSDTLRDWETAVDTPIWYSRQNILAFSFLALPCLYFLSKTLFKRRVWDA